MSYPMCGRYSFAVEDALILERFGIRVRTAIYKARYNCAPTQNLAVIANEAPDTMQFFRWGLIPSWHIGDMGVDTGHDPYLPRINARAETVLEKPSFKNAFRNRRCLVPATGFFEWKRTPWVIGLKNGDPFCFAGLWDKWVSPDGEIIHSFTIITTRPNKLMIQIHDRMPVILRREDEQRWIAPQPDPTLVELLQPYPEEEMEAWPVSKLVNTVVNDGPEILEHLPEGPMPGQLF
ncbi:MAG: SOS response-associated peptidase [Bacteroidales bacterium]